VHLLRYLSQIKWGQISEPVGVQSARQFTTRPRYNRYFRYKLFQSAPPLKGVATGCGWAGTPLALVSINTEAAALARMHRRSVAEVLQGREDTAIAVLSHLDSPDSWKSGFLQSGEPRRIIRNGRSYWGAYLPQRRNHEVRLKHLTFGQMRHDNAAMVLAGG
jgi:hypothetical protein